MIKRITTAIAVSAALATSGIAYAASHAENPMVGGAEMMADKTIAENARNAPNLTTVVAAAEAAGLASTFEGEGPLTVFAPTNEAFEALPAGTVDTLLQEENKDQLTGILTYHVVSGNVMAADAMKMIEDDGGEHTVETVNGATLTLKMDGENLTITDQAGNTATVVTADVKQSNGVVHVIDTVLMPQ